MPYLTPTDPDHPTNEAEAHHAETAQSEDCCYRLHPQGGDHRMSTTDPTTHEAGAPTPWDVAHREGRSWAYEALLGVPTPTAHRLATGHIRAPRTRLARLAAWLLRREIERTIQ